jgi:hypothetical protein
MMIICLLPVCVRVTDSAREVLVTPRAAPERIGERALRFVCSPAPHSNSCSAAAERWCGLYSWESGQVVVCFAEGVLWRYLEKTTARAYISTKRNSNGQVSRRLTRGKGHSGMPTKFSSPARWLNLEHRLVAYLCVAGVKWDLTDTQAPAEA